MKLNETTLPFLEVDCIQQFGQEKGMLIFEQAEKIYQELLNNADYRNNAAIQNHLQLKLFPTLAYYKALRGEGIKQFNKNGLVKMTMKTPKREIEKELYAPSEDYVQKKSFFR